MNIDQIEARMAEIKEELNGECDVEALTQEVDELEARKAELEAEAEKRSALIDKVNAGEAGTVIEKRSEEKPMENKTYNASSAEYRSAWLKKMATDSKGNMLLGQLDEAEERAFTFTTANSDEVVPTVTQNRIIDRVKAEAPMLADAAISAMSEGFAIPVRTAIAAGDAAIVAEDGANVDEEDTFDLITMPGVDIKKHAVMTRRMKFQSIDAFEDWLVADISKRILVAKERVLLARLDGVAPAQGVSANAKVAIDSGNILESKDGYTDLMVRNALAKLDENGDVVVYANRATIYNGLASIESEDGHKRFIESAMVDPVVKGVIYGAAVKVDANLPDDVAYFGVVGSLKANSFAPLEVFTTIEAKTANRIFTGTEVFDAGLENPKAFVKVNFNPTLSE